MEETNQLLRQVLTTVAGLHGQMTGFRQEMRTGMEEFRQEIGAEMTGFRQEMRTGMEEFRQEIGVEMTGFRQEMQTGMEEFRQEIGAEMTGFRQEMQTGMEGFKQEIGAEMTGFRQELQEMRVDQQEQMSLLCKEVGDMGCQITDLQKRVINLDKRQSLLEKEVRDGFNKVEYRLLELEKDVHYGYELIGGKFDRIKGWQEQVDGKLVSQDQWRKNIELELNRALNSRNY